jgi:hypothetical protein
MLSAGQSQIILRLLLATLAETWELVKRPVLCREGPRSVTASLVTLLFGQRRRAGSAGRNRSLI